MCGFVNGGLKLNLTSGLRSDGVVQHVRLGVPGLTLECAGSLSAGSQMATSVPNKQFCPVKNMAHITVKGFISLNIF